MGLRRALGEGDLRWLCSLSPHNPRRKWCHSPLFRPLASCVGQAPLPPAVAAPSGPSEAFRWPLSRPLAAEVIVACLDNPHRFKNARQVAAYAGLVPKQFQSGTMNRRGRITKRDPEILRAMLVKVSLGHAEIQRMGSRSRSTHQPRPTNTQHVVRLSGATATDPHPTPTPHLP